MSVLVVRMSAFLFTLYTAVCKTKLVWPRPKVVVPGSNGPQFQGARRARQALWDGRSNSILKWLHLHHLFPWSQSHSVLLFCYMLPWHAKKFWPINVRV